ncbi:PREDICTED: exocyst complex component 3-like protein 2, partial [Nanorana parkeri]|uniref:exocyst complex component 3-like protein 2 n=1 Tax=Nanorana parkeri TaxID=125878 RepID=UPI0008549932
WREVKWSEVEGSEVEWSEVKWSEVEGSEVEWREVKWSEVQGSEVKCREVEWREVKWSGVKWREVEWSEVEGSGVKWSFHKTVERFYSEQDGVTGTTETFICRVTNIVNCCPPFREFATRMSHLDKTQGAELLRQVEGTLERIVRLGTRGICDLVLLDLKLLGRRWLGSSEACDGIVSGLTECALTLRRLSPGPYQATVSELHRRVLLEYVRPLIQGKMSCTASRTRKRTATKLREENRQLTQIFSKLVISPPPSSPPNILRSSSPCSLSHCLVGGVSSVSRERLHPPLLSFRKRHLSSLLDVRGLWDPSERQQILGVLHDLEGADAGPPCRGGAGFFSDVSITHDTHCIHVTLSRASRIGRRTLTLLSRRRRMTSNHVGGGGAGGLSPGEEDTQL